MTAALRLAPVSEHPDDEHAICPPPCGGLMSFDATSGHLICDDCNQRTDHGGTVTGGVMTEHELTITAEALYASPLQPSDHPGVEEVQDAVHDMILHLGADVCALLLAQESGDHPDMSAARMRWARATVRAAYADVAALV